MRPRGDVGDLLFEAVNVAHVCAPLSGLRFWPHTGGWSQSDNGAKTEYTVFNADMVYLGEKRKKSPAGWSGIECVPEKGQLREYDLYAAWLAMCS